MKEQKFLANGGVLEPARVADVPQIVDLIVTVQLQTYPDVVEESLRPALRQHITSTAFRNSLEKRYLESIQSPESGPTCVVWTRQGLAGVSRAGFDGYGNHMLSALYVAQQGKGYGTALADEVELWQIEHGAKSSRVDVVCHTPAVCFYERRGFRGFGALYESSYKEGSYLLLGCMKTAFPRQPGRCVFDKKSPPLNMS